MVDNLEEEHMRRDVFTTAIDGATISMNPAHTPNDNSHGKISHDDSSLTPTGQKDTPYKWQAKASDKLQAKQDLKILELTTAEKSGIIKRRGPRKKKEVVQQSEVLAAGESSRMKR